MSNGAPSERRRAKGERKAVAELREEDRQAVLDTLRDKGLRFLNLSDDELHFWALHYGLIAER